MFLKYQKGKLNESKYIAKTRSEILKNLDLIKLISNRGKAWNILENNV